MGLWMQNVSNMTDLIYFRKSCIMSVVKIALNLSRLKTCIVSLGSVDHTFLSNNDTIVSAKLPLAIGVVWFLERHTVTQAPLSERRF